MAAGLALWAWLGGAALAGPGAPVPSVAQEPVGGVWTPIFDTAEHWVRYEVGNRSGKGKAVIEVRGDGTVNVTVTRGGDVERSRGRLTPGRFTQLRAQLRANDPRALASAREIGQPEEARVRVAVGGPSGDHTAELWYGERYTNAHLDALVLLFHDVAAEITGQRGVW